MKFVVEYVVFRTEIRKEEVIAMDGTIYSADIPESVKDDHIDVIDAADIHEAKTIADRYYPDAVRAIRTPTFQEYMEHPNRYE